MLVDIIEHEKNRQWKGLELIPSENFVSSSVMEAVGSVMTNKYSEGYPGESLLLGGGLLFFSRALPSLLVQKGVSLDGWVGGGGAGEARESFFAPLSLRLQGQGRRKKLTSSLCPLTLLSLSLAQAPATTAATSSSTRPRPSASSVRWRPSASTRRSGASTCSRCRARRLTSR